MISNFGKEAPVNEASTALDSKDHNKDLNFVRGVVESLESPSETLLRVKISLQDAGDDPLWLRPNVSFRLNLGADFEDASRIYTVRSFDVANQSFDMDVVIHPGQSPMMRWADSVRLHDVVRIVGPRPHFIFPETDKPVAVFADETAIPALYSILRSLPAGARGVAWVQSRAALPVDELPGLQNFPIHRLPDDGSTGVVEERELSRAAANLAHPEEFAIWAAGERETMRFIRRHFRTTHSLPKDQVAVYGYWKHGMSNTEIDRRRQANYVDLVAKGGVLADVDDLSIVM